MEDTASMTLPHNPAYTVVCADCRMRAVHEDYLVPVMLAVTRNEIGIQDFTVREALARTLLSDKLIVLPENLRGAEMLGVAAAVKIRTLVRACRNALSHDKNALLGAVAQSACAVKPCWTRKPQGCRVPTPAY